MKDDIDTLLERRKEIQIKIDQLTKEYNAIGRVLHELLEYIENEKQEKEDEEDEMPSLC